MKFDTASKIWECAGKDRTRPILTYVHLAIEDTDDGRKGWLEATDSYVLARVPVISLDPDDTAGLIPVDVLKAAAKDSNGVLSCNGSFSLADGRSWPRPEDLGTFPEAKHLIPDADTFDPERTSAPFGIDPALLVRALKALGGRKHVRVIVNTPLKPVLIEALGGVPGAQCVLMPTRLGN